VLSDQLEVCCSSAFQNRPDLAASIKPDILVTYSARLAGSSFPSTCVRPPPPPGHMLDDDCCPFWRSERKAATRRIASIAS
jgi:hypothetical protein